MPNIWEIWVFRNWITTSMSEISRVGKESGKLQHQFYQVTLPLQTHFDVLDKYFRLQIKPNSFFGRSVFFMKNFRSQGLRHLLLYTSKQVFKIITITAIEQGAHIALSLHSSPDQLWCLCRKEHCAWYGRLQKNTYLP